MHVKITAINLYGNSLESIPGDGAAVIFLPAAPQNLANSPLITNAT